jgi:hypothetical protein
VSQRAVEQVLGKLLTDEAFRESFLADPARATVQSGLTLTPPELEALRRVSRQALVEFAAGLDGRICRLWVDPTPQRMEPTS